MTFQEQLRVLAVVGAVAGTGLALWLLMTAIASRDRKGRLTLAAWFDWLIFLIAVIVAAATLLLR